jgi:hypothetical protein
MVPPLCVAAVQCGRGWFDYNLPRDAEHRAVEIKTLTQRTQGIHDDPRAFTPIGRSTISLHPSQLTAGRKTRGHHMEAIGSLRPAVCRFAFAA